VDDHMWSTVAEWCSRVMVLVLTVTTTRRRLGSVDVVVQLVRQLPAGGEVAGRLPDGTVWYVRMPKPPDDHS
jgi:hypothetical protein